MKLAKMLLAAVWVVGLALPSAAYADPPAVVGRLNYLSGPVSFAPAEASEDWVAATLNRPITTGDRLWTDNNAFAEMHVGSLAVRMAPQTSMDVLNLDDRALQLRVAQGDMNLRVRRLSSGRLIEIATPNGAVVVREPGSYRISVDGDSSTVTVRAGGQAEVFTAGSSVLVRDGEEVAISRSRPELFAASQPDEFDRWAADRDRRHDRVASTRYVPVEMTGYEDLDQYGEWRTVAEYGNVWIPSSVPTDWAPYRYGHWVWIAPWGWTWVDDQPWGFAPSHYGRWVWYDNYWAWAPGRLVERPVYSPALVAFIGGANFSVSIGPAVGWVPLGYREPYIPWYTASPTYLRNVNVTHVTNVTNINTTNIRYVNRTVPTGVTVVSRDNFIAARPVQQATINVPSRTLATAPVTRGAPVSQPARTSLARSQPGSRPPAQVLSREAVVVNQPPAAARELARESRDDRSAPRVAASAERLPVRVIERRERVSLPVNQAPRAEARAARPAIQPPRADAPAAPQRQPQAVQEQRPRDQQTRQQEQAREQQGERLREQKRDAEQQQKAQAQQQADQIERERKQRSGQQEQAREQQRTQQEQQRQQQQGAQEQRAREQQQQKAAQEQRQRQEEQRTQQERERGQKAAQEQLRAQQEQQRAQQAAQKAQQEQQRAQQEQQRAQQEQQRAQQAAAEAQKAQQEAQRGRERERAEKAAQEQLRAQQDQQRAQQEQQRAQQAAQKAQQEQQRAQQAAQKAQQEQQRAQQEQQRAQQAAAQAQKAQQEQQRAQQAAQQAAAREAQQRAQRPEAAQAAPKQDPAEAEKGNRERGRKADKD